MLGGLPPGLRQLPKGRGVGRRVDARVRVSYFRPPLGEEGLSSSYNLVHPRSRVVDCPGLRPKLRELVSKSKEAQEAISEKHGLRTS